MPVRDQFLCDRNTESLGLEGSSGDDPLQPRSQSRATGNSDTGTHPAGSGIYPQEETPRPPWAAVQCSATLNIKFFLVLR